MNRNRLFQLMLVLLFSLLGAQSLRSTTIQRQNVSFQDNGVRDYETLIVGIPGQGETSLDFVQTLSTASSKCKQSIRIISPSIEGTSYNLVERRLVGNLTLKNILDGLVEQFATKNVMMVGFSKGSQAVQRYALIHSIKVPARFVLGCASSFTFLNDSIDYRYGLRNFPFPLPSQGVVQHLRASHFHFECGSNDVKDLDKSSEAQAQGSGRVERAQNLEKQFKSLGIQTSFQTVDNVGHNATLVIGAIGGFICPNDA